MKNPLSGVWIFAFLGVDDLRRERMKTHTLMQTYKQNYFKLCMTGIYGCKWHRYKQSAFSSNKSDMFWLAFLITTVFFVIFWFYFWLVAQNDQENFNWFIFHQVNPQWFSWYHLFLGLASLVFVYGLVLLLLSLYHVIFGYQVFLHLFHRLLLVLIVVCSVVMIIVLVKLWPDEWDVQRISLKMFGPFLQIAIVAMMTPLTWILIDKWNKLNNIYVKSIFVPLYLGIMITLYVWPFVIHSPCVTEKVPTKPQLFAHKGASAVAPENTIVSFQESLRFSEGIESDIRISNDGIPFIMHDSTLRRTTNVAEVFPDRQDERPETFNMSELQQLNAGSWFIKNDPYGTTSKLTASQKDLISNQTIPTLQELLDVIKDGDINFLMDINGSPMGHMFSTLNQTVKLFKDSGIPRKRFFLQDGIPDFIHSGFTITIRNRPSLGHLRRMQSHSVNDMYSWTTEQDIINYRNNNISVNIFNVNSHWLFSYFWCLGVSSVTTDMCHTLSQEKSPLWTMTPTVYLAVWITVDALSVGAVIIMFIIQCTRLDRSQSLSESLALHPPRQKENPIMDEKLLDAAKDIGMEGEIVEDQGTINPVREHYSTCSDADWARNPSV